MKFTINVECTPEEARRFVGLPDVTPLNPPLGLVSPIPPKQHRLAETANLSPIAALAASILDVPVP